MDKSKWIWMPHPGHFICAIDCRFRLNTYVGKYIVSTVGELLYDSALWDIEAKSKGVKLEGIGDYKRADYLKKIGYAEIGYNRKYETMVFKAKKAKDKCCPYRVSDHTELDFDGYNDSGNAHAGHLKMCEKWSKK